MGIPVFFKTLITDYNHIIKTSLSVDNLFFDLNCLIHPCCAISKDKNETIMIQLIIENIYKLIKLSGAKFIYIAIDGPAPKAKMMQQRIRRLKSILENKEWDTNAITPGTIFMNQLNIALHKEFTQSNIIISDSNEPGEGEHKILQYLKLKKDIFSKQINCIYGLDADLIMLSMVSGLKNIYLLRERTSFNIEQIDSEYLYLDISELIKQITNNFPGLIKKTIINDYIFICFLLGNDFIKHSPSLILRYDGLNYITDIYKQCQINHSNKFYLINLKTKNLIHWNHFKEFIYLLSLSENGRIKDIFSIRLKQHRKYKQIYHNIQKNKDIITNEYKPKFACEDIMRHKPIIFMNDEKYIFENKGNWINRYNTFTLTFSHDICPVNILNEKVQKLCYDYIESLVWTTQYYFKECISQEWYYPYEFAPTLHDLDLFLKNNKRIYIKPNYETYTPINQLRFVLPYQSYHLCKELINEKKEEILEIKKEYSLLKRYDWECEPII